jgi:hypothetical protein
MSRAEFIKQAATKLGPLLLALAAVGTGLFVYRVLEPPYSAYKAGLLVLLVLFFAYPVLKKRYGPQIWNRLPPAVQVVLQALRLVALVLVILFLLLLGLAMPILLVLACVQLLIENYRLREELERLDPGRAEL